MTSVEEWSSVCLSVSKLPGGLTLPPSENTDTTPLEINSACTRHKGDERESGIFPCTLTYILHHSSLSVHQRPNCNILDTLQWLLHFTAPLFLQQLCEPFLPSFSSEWIFHTNIISLPPHPPNPTPTCVQTFPGLVLFVNLLIFVPSTSHRHKTIWHHC